MPPKIEEVDRPPVKNPFAPKDKKVTIRRDAKEIYSKDQLRKGLNNPSLTNASPLDKLFLDLEGKVQGQLNDLDAETLCKRFDIKNPDAFTRRFLLIQKLLDSILEIQDLSSKEKHQDENLISISLHDIRTFSKVVNLVIVLGVYPPLATFNIGIPLAKRRLNEFSKLTKPIHIDKLPFPPNATTLPEKYKYTENLLTLVYGKLKEIFRKDSDVKDLLIRGTGYSDFLTIAVTLITCPYFEESHRRSLANEFDSFVMELPPTYELFQTFSLLLASPSPPFFKQFVMARLQVLHYRCPRNDGLLTLIEFVLGLRDNEDVSVERFDNVANVVLQKPKSIPTAEYFKSIGNQCFELLVNINRPLVGSCVCHVIERLWERNRLVVQDFFLKRIWNNLAPEKVEDIKGGTVLTSEKELNNTINVLLSLTKKNFQSDILQYLFSPIILSLWSYFVFLSDDSKRKDIPLNILASYLISVKDSEDLEGDLFGLDKISRNLLYEDDNWVFEFGANNLVQIVKKGITIGENKDNRINKFITNLDKYCKAFISLLSDLDDSYVLDVFIRALRRWLKLNSQDSLDNSDQNPFLVLVDLRLIESIGNEFKENIARTPIEMLAIVKEFLSSPIDTKKGTKENKLAVLPDSDDEDSDDEDDFEVELSSQSYPILLELLSAVLSEVSETSIDKDCHKMLQDISSRLKKLLEGKSGKVVSENKKSTEALAKRIEHLLEGEIPVSSQKDLDSKILERAIANLNDPLVPVRAHGLYLLRQLTESKSEVISVDFVTELHLVQLQDPEPFIYLNVIKGLESLLESDPNTVLATLIGIYTDNSKELDERLRIGEVVLRFIQNSNELFTGSLAKVVVDATLQMISRSGEADAAQDDRIRMSAMSLLGTCCKVNPLGIISDLENALDCAIGILQLETAQDKAIMRRSAVVLIHDLVIGTSSSSEVPFPQVYREKVINVLNYIVETDTDLLTREQASTVLSDIDELTKLAYELLQETL